MLHNFHIFFQYVIIPSVGFREIQTVNKYDRETKLMSTFPYRSMGESL